MCYLLAQAVLFLLSFSNAKYLNKPFIHATTELIVPSPSTIEISTNCRNTLETLDEWKNYALFFAANDYPKDSGYNPLRYPISDAESIAKVLEDNYNFETRICRNPTESDIYKILEEYKDKFNKKEYDPNGQLLIYFTGHGDTLNSSGFFIPSNVKKGAMLSTSNPYSLIRSAIDIIPCKHIQVVLDVCYGGIFDPKYDFKSGQRPNELTPRDYLLENHNKKKTRIFLASTYDKQIQDNSEFARQFLKKLDQVDADDGIITTMELFAHLENFKCSPYYGTFGRNETHSNFLFIDNRWKPFHDIICDLQVGNNKITLEKGQEKIAIDRLNDDKSVFKIPTGYWKKKESFQLSIYSNNQIKRIHQIEIKDEGTFCTLLTGLLQAKN